MDPIAMGKNYSALKKYDTDGDDRRAVLARRKRKRRARAPWPYAVSATKLAHCRDTIMGCAVQGMTFEQTAAKILKEAHSSPELNDLWHSYFEKCANGEEVGMTLKPTPQVMEKVIDWFEQTDPSTDEEMHEWAENAGVNTHQAEAAAYQLANAHVDEGHAKQSKLSAPQGLPALMKIAIGPPAALAREAAERAAREAAERAAREAMERAARGAERYARSGARAAETIAAKKPGQQILKAMSEAPLRPMHEALQTHLSGSLGHAGMPSGARLPKTVMRGGRRVPAVIQPRSPYTPAKLWKQMPGYGKVPVGIRTPHFTGVDVTRPAIPPVVHKPVPLPATTSARSARAPADYPYRVRSSSKPRDHRVFRQKKGSYPALIKLADGPGYNPAMVRGMANNERFKQRMARGTQLAQNALGRAGTVVKGLPTASAGLIQEGVGRAAQGVSSLPDAPFATMFGWKPYAPLYPGGGAWGKEMARRGDLTHRAASESVLQALNPWGEEKSYGSLMSEDERRRQATMLDEIKRHPKQTTAFIPNKWVPSVASASQAVGESAAYSAPFAGAAPASTVAAPGVWGTEAAFLVPDIANRELEQRGGQFGPRVHPYDKPKLVNLPGGVQLVQTPGGVYAPVVEGQPQVSPEVQKYWAQKYPRLFTPATPAASAMPRDIASEPGYPVPTLFANPEYRMSKQSKLSAPQGLPALPSAPVGKAGYPALMKLAFGGPAMETLGEQSMEMTHRPTGLTEDYPRYLSEAYNPFHSRPIRDVDWLDPTLRHAGRAAAAIGGTAGTLALTLPASIGSIPLTLAGGGGAAAPAAAATAAPAAAATAAPAVPATAAPAVPAAAKGIGSAAAAAPAAVSAASPWLRTALGAAKWLGTGAILGAGSKLTSDAIARQQVQNAIEGAKTVSKSLGSSENQAILDRKLGAMAKTYGTQPEAVGNLLHQAAVNLAVHDPTVGDLQHTDPRFMNAVRRIELGYATGRLPTDARVYIDNVFGATQVAQPQPAAPAAGPESVSAKTPLAAPQPTSTVATAPTTTAPIAGPESVSAKTPSVAPAETPEAGPAETPEAGPQSTIPAALDAAAAQYAKLLPDEGAMWTDEQFVEAESKFQDRAAKGHRPNVAEIEEYLGQYVARATRRDPQQFGQKMAQIFAGGQPDRETIANIIKEFGVQIKGGMTDEDIAKMMQDRDLLTRVIGWFTDPQTPIHHKLGVGLGIPLAIVGSAMTLMGRGGISGLLLAGIGGAGALMGTGLLDPLINWAIGGDIEGFEEHRSLGGAAPSTPDEPVATTPHELQTPAPLTEPGFAGLTAGGQVPGQPAGAAAPVAGGQAPAQPAGAAWQPPANWKQLLYADLRKDKKARAALQSLFEGMPPEVREVLDNAVAAVGRGTSPQQVADYVTKTTGIAVTPEDVAQMVAVDKQRKAYEAFKNSPFGKLFG